MLAVFSTSASTQTNVNFPWAVMVSQWPCLLYLHMYNSKGIVKETTHHYFVRSRGHRPWCWTLTNCPKTLRLPSISLTGGVDIHCTSLCVCVCVWSFRQESMRVVKSGLSWQLCNIFLQLSLQVLGLKFCQIRCKISLCQKGPCISQIVISPLPFQL